MALSITGAAFAQQEAPKVKPKPAPGTYRSALPRRQSPSNTAVRSHADGNCSESWCPTAASGARARTDHGIEVSTKVMFEGQELPAGKYSVWAEPGPEKWIVIFSKQANVFHTRYPVGQDALRLEVTPRTGSHMETLAFYFPVVDGRKGELALHWGTVVVPLRFEVP